MKNLNNKNKYILFGLIGAFIIIGIITFGISFAYTDNDPLKNQKVDGLSFENAKVEYNNEISTFTVAVYNETEGIYNAKEIEITIKDKSNEETTLIGVIGEKLESDEGRIITATTNKDITNIKSIEYEIKK